MASFKGPLLKSPDGRRTIRVYFNDAGAMHTGPYHWTYFVEDSWLWGRQVISEGYTNPEATVRGGDRVTLPIEWTPQNEIRVRYFVSKYSDQEVTR
jgi:hypothetical protein